MGRGSDRWRAPTAARLPLAALLVAVGVPPLAADSDGYFCTAPTYLAYEVGLPGHGAHELRVVSLEPPLSDRSLRSVPLPDFQVHGLLCFDAEVVLLGWESLYTVGVRPAEELVLRSEKLPLAGEVPQPFREAPRRNLGSIAGEQTLPLTTRNANFFLVTRLAPTERPCELRVASALEDVDHEGLLRFSLPLYDGTRRSECGE